jgi:hypothetical protein
MAIAITVVAGASVFGFVNNQARVSEINYANSVGTTDNFLNENFKVIDMYYSTSNAGGGGCTSGYYCTTGFWLYSTGTLNLQAFSVRLYDCTAGSTCGSNINILYNYTVSAGTKTDRVYDVRASAANYFSTCRATGSTYENPTLSTVNAKTQNAQLVLLTVPPDNANCPSYHNFWTTSLGFKTGTPYYITVTGLYGNVITYYQVK